MGRTIKKRIEKKGGLLVISGPSGAGKTTICRQLAAHDEVTLSVSATTRPKRPDEVEGKDYFFLSRQEFEARIAREEFIEYNEVFKNGHYYGSLKEEMAKGLADPSRYYLMEIDVRGALNLRKLSHEGTYIFIMPPSAEELKKRLVNRRTDNSDSIESRLKKAEWELDQVEHYDLVVVNEELTAATEQVVNYLRLD